jgi:hypothetical protein
MPDRWYEAAKVPPETAALIEALDDPAMRDVAMSALHKRHRELSKAYGQPAPPECKSWGDGRYHFAAIEKECDAIKRAARDKGFGGCHNPPMNCERGCWGDIALFP